LNARERLQIYIRENRPDTLQGAATACGVSREYVRQIAAKDPELKAIIGAVRAEKRALKEAERLAKENAEVFASGMSCKEFYSDDLRKKQKTKFNNKKHNCNKTLHQFDIEFGDLEWPTHCPALGLELDYATFGSYRMPENAASFDRIDPSLGYVKGNVVIISWRANRIKNDGTAAEHRAIAEWLEKIEE
jgi:hypothetical protein